MENNCIYTADYKEIHYISPNIASLALAEGLEELNISIPNNVTSISFPASLKVIPNLNKYNGNIAIAENSIFEIEKGVIYSENKTKIETGTGRIDQIKEDGKLDGIFDCPSTVTSIKDNAFYTNNSIKEADLSKSQIRIISENAFRNCTILEKVNLNIGLEQINVLSFYANYKLKEIEIPDKVNTIGSNAFAFTGLENINIPASVISMVNPFGGYNILKTITIDENNPKYKSKGNAIYSKNGEELVGVSYYTNESVFEGVKVIKTSAFVYADIEENIVLPNSITTIEEYAFRLTEGLKQIPIPSSVTSINFTAFTLSMDLMTMNIYKTKDQLIGAPWGNPNGIRTVNWLGTE